MVEIPPIAVLALGILGAGMLVKLVAKMRGHANAELDSLRTQTINEKTEQRPTLRRDPRTGVYRL